jgi:tetratricopeptide (TPR) repeat protein
VIQLVTPALDRNPRRLKRFVNLYTLTTLLLSAKRDRQDRSEAETLVEGDATMEQIGKFVAITLRWPGLFGEIQKNTWLLEALTLVALWRRYDEAYVWWRQYYETQSRTDNATGATEEPADRDEEVEAGTPETRVVNEVESLTTELPEDEISVLLDLLIAGMYSDEGEGDRTDEDRQERSSTNPLHDEFESVARKFRTKFQTHDGVEFFEEVGVARIQTLTGVDETYSLANEDIVRTLLEASPSTTVLGEQQYEKILEYRDQLTRNQKDTRIRLRLANLLATRGRVDEAEKHYRTALEHSPKTTEPHSAYATFLSERNRPAEAEQQYKAAIRTNPGNEFSYYEYADFLEAQDRHEEAEEQYRIALDLDPEGVTTHTRYADFLKRRNRLDEAEELYRITLDLTSDSPYRSVYGVHTGLAEVLVRQERLEEAEEQYRAALELNPDNWRSNYGFADLLARQGRDDEAEHHYRKGMELEPIRPEPYRAYAEFLRKRGRDEEAEPYERRAERYEQ